MKILRETIRKIILENLKGFEGLTNDAIRIILDKKEKFSNLKFIFFLFLVS